MQRFAAAVLSCLLTASCYGQLTIERTSKHLLIRFSTNQVVRFDPAAVVTIDVAADQSVVVQVGSGPSPTPPGPDPPDPIPPGPDPPEPDPPTPVIDNAYGVGQVAYDNATGEGADAVGITYRQAADFLYGKPEAKTIEEALAWIKTQIDEQWQPWHAAVSAALIASQQAREGGYTRSDWYHSLREIASALEAVR